MAGNPLQTLKLQPWIEEKALVNAPVEGDPEAPGGHLSYTFDSETDASVTIRLQE